MRFDICALVLLLASALALACTESEFEKPSYEVGEVGNLLVTNPSPLSMAIGGCNPQFIEIREPGRWVSPPTLIHSACAFATSLDGSHTLSRYELIPPGETLAVKFGTRFVEETPSILRLRQRVSIGCDSPAAPGDPILCRAVEHIVTGPIVVFEPGTTDTFDPR